MLVPAPTLGLWAALEGAPPFGRFLFAASKLWLLLLPAVWSRWVDGEPWRWPRWRGEGWRAGLGSGLAIAAGIVAAYALIGRHWIDAAHVRAVAKEVGLADPGLYLVAAAYWCLVNALLEEYVWRWFVFRKCAAFLRPLSAVLLSALFFTLHHVLALHAYFDARVVIVGSLGVFIGGVTWSWCYRRFRSIWPGYLSHIGADLAVFGVGAWILFG